MIWRDEQEPRDLRRLLLVSVLASLAAAGVAIGTGQWFAAVGWLAAAGAAWIARCLA